MTAPHEAADKVLDPACNNVSLSDTPEDATKVQACLITLQEQLDQALAQVKEQTEQALRARAEAENVRRRTQEDVAKAYKFSIEAFAESILPVKDSLEAALGQTDQTLNSLNEGLQATLKQLSAVFERNRLTEIVPNQGDKFDPHLHQAISSVPSPQPTNTVVNNLQKGYKLVDRVLRPALVMVSTGIAGSGET